MSIFLENIGNILNPLLAWLGQMSIALIQNPIFIILMSTIILIILYNLIKNIINKKEIEKMPYFNLDNEYTNWKNNYSQNAKDMEEEENNDFLDSIM